MKPRRGIDLQAPINVDKLRQHFELQGKVMSNISFGSTTDNKAADRNIQCWTATGTTPDIPGTQFSVTHNLDRIPIGFITISISKAGHLIDANKANWTAATNSAQGTIFLTSDTADMQFIIQLI